MLFNFADVNNYPHVTNINDVDLASESSKGSQKNLIAEYQF